MTIELWCPYRICCGQQHWGAVCPDTMVMCCICFHRFPQEELAVDADGTKWDVCKGCDEDEKKWMNHEAEEEEAEAPGDEV